MVAGRWRAASQGNRVNVALEFPGLADALDRLVAALVEDAAADTPPPPPAEAPLVGPWGVPVETTVTVVQRPLLAPPARPAAAGDAGLPVVESTGGPPARATVRAEDRKRRSAPPSRPGDDDPEAMVPAGVAAERVLHAAKGDESIAVLAWGPRGPRPMKGRLLKAMCEGAARRAAHAQDTPDPVSGVEVTPSGEGVVVDAVDFLDGACPDDPDGVHHVGCGCDTGEDVELARVAAGIDALSAGELVDRWHSGDVPRILPDEELEG